MLSGRTSHSSFKIPINIDESNFNNISKQSGTTELLRKAKLITWDEAPMTKRWDIEAFDRTLKDIMDTHLVFDGKVIVFGRDFRQVLSIVPQGIKVKTINTSLVMSYLWPKMKNLRLATNMRSRSNTIFSHFLLHVGNGDEPIIDEDMIEIPNEMLIKYGDEENPEEFFINEFHLLKDHAYSIEYIIKQDILATKNDNVDMLNEKLIEIFAEKSKTYYNFDFTVDNTQNYYQEEF